jgi:hypothetical protein
MYYKLFDPPDSRHLCYKVMYILILIQVIDPESTLHSHWYFNILLHRLSYLSHLIGIVHKQSTETPLYSLCGGTPTV